MRGEPFPRRNRGSPIWASCRVSLLASTDIPSVIETPWYLAALREYETQELKRLDQQKQTGDESQPR